MSRPPLALVANDARFAGMLVGTLESVCPSHPSRLTVLRWDFDSVRAHLNHDSEGLLLLACASAEDVEPILSLVREISIQRFPVVILLVEALNENSLELASLEPYVASHLSWPDDANQLIQLVQDRLHRVRGFADIDNESVEEVIRRRLLTLTPSLLPLVERIAIAASHEVTVLFTGETGTGKTHLARLMHDCSPRRGEPFLAVPCGALPANLIESTFFGHVRGAFTGADRNKIGKFEAAGHGTLLLDEIDALPLEQQAGLLRVIETGEFEPLGSNETHRCQARVIVASNWDLEEAVRERKFREDLYYRLNVMSFHLPALRERVEDIAPLARGLAARFNTKFRKQLHDVSPEATDVLESQPWPGNIRQLENAVQQSVLVSSGPELLVEHLPLQLRQTPGAGNVSSVGEPPDSLAHNREVLERNIIQRALANHDYSRVRAAHSLGISRVTLYKKMKKYGLMEIPLRSQDG